MKLGKTVEGGGQSKWVVGGGTGGQSNLSELVDSNSFRRK